MRTWTKESSSTHALPRGEAVSVRSRARTCKVVCLAGRLWVTATGNPDDVVLTPGQETTFLGKTRIVIEALQAATVRVELCTPARVSQRVLDPQPVL